MREVTEILDREYSGLLSSYRERLDDITRMRTSGQRIDSYILLLREMLVKSSLCKVNEVFSFFDGRSYVAIDPKKVNDTIYHWLSFVIQDEDKSPVLPQL